MAGRGEKDVRNPREAQGERGCWVGTEDCHQGVRIRVGGRNVCSQRR